MDDEWDEESFDPENRAVVDATARDKWLGEDEDEEVKDNWEDEEEEKEEKKDVEKQNDETSTKAVQVKKSKKNLTEKIEEKERLAKEEMEKELEAKKLGNEVKRELTAEERYEEKLLQQKLQEEADLRVAMETFGLTGEPSAGNGLDSNPSTEEEFNEYQTLLIAKMDSLAKSPHFPAFAEEIVRNLSLNLPVASLKKLKSVTEAICTEKLKLEKGDKSKKKGKGKAQLRFEGNANLMSEYSAYKGLDDYDDFM